MFRTKMTVRVVETGDTRRLKLTRKNTGRVIAKRAQEALTQSAPSWDPKVTHSKGHITLELTMRARSEGEAIAKSRYWIERILGPAKLTLDPREIVSVEATPCG